MRAGVSRSPPTFGFVWPVTLAEIEIVGESIESGSSFATAAFKLLARLLALRCDPDSSRLRVELQSKTGTGHDFGFAGNRFGRPCQNPAI